MLLLDAPLTFHEYMTHEDVPLASVFREVLTYLRSRDDAVLFGAQAVNAYCEPPRMTADVDVLSTCARGLADDLRDHLGARFHVAIRVREVVAGVGFRVYQIRRPKNRHLVDIRQTESLPTAQRIEGVQVAMPLELVAMKVVAIAARSGREKELSDRLDVVRLLRTFPELKTRDGSVRTRLGELRATADAFVVWDGLVNQSIAPDEDDGY
ncbi:MAG TPA: hypothetical protein VF395_01260 [Polyangiaceae bacterium]